MSSQEVVQAGPPAHAKVTNEIVAGRTIQQVKTAYTAAVNVQKRRDCKEVVEKLLQEADQAGEDFFYAWGKGKNSIEGPSVNLALAAARCWGNCAVEIQPVRDDAHAWYFTAVFVDLETGFTLARTFRQSKQSVVSGNLDPERKDDIRFQIGQSKAIRNVILNALPEWLLRQAREQAKTGVRQRIQRYIATHGIARATDYVLRALSRLGVREDAVLAKFGVPDRKAISIDHLVAIKGDINALEKGTERLEELYPSPQVPSRKSPDLPQVPGASQAKAPEAAANRRASARQIAEISRHFDRLRLNPEEQRRMLDSFRAMIPQDLSDYEACLLLEQLGQVDTPPENPGEPDPGEPDHDILERAAIEHIEQEGSW